MSEADKMNHLAEYDELKRKFETLERKFAHHVNIQIATLETLEERKSASKNDLARQKAIVVEMIDVIKELGLSINIHSPFGMVFESDRIKKRWNMRADK